eukprot:9106041-Prorocentrum_lima.AAC.1
MDATSKILEYDTYRHEMFTFLRARGEYDQSLVYFQVDSGVRDFGHIPFESEIFACFHAHVSNIGRDV